MAQPTFSAEAQAFAKIYLEAQKASMLAAANAIATDSAAAIQYLTSQAASGPRSHIDRLALELEENETNLAINRAIQHLQPPVDQPPIQFESKIRRNLDGSFPPFRYPSDLDRLRLCTHYFNNVTNEAATSRRFPQHFAAMSEVDRTAMGTFITNTIQRQIQQNLARGGSQTRGGEGTLREYSGKFRQIETFAEVIGLPFDITKEPPDRVVVIAFINMCGHNPEDPASEEIEQSLLEMAMQSPTFKEDHCEYLLKFLKVRGCTLGTVQKFINVIRIFLGVNFHQGLYMDCNGVRSGDVLSDVLVKESLAAVLRKIQDYKYIVLRAPKMDLFNDAKTIISALLDFHDPRPHPFSRFIQAAGWLASINGGLRRGERSQIELIGFEFPINPQTGAIWVDTDGFPKFARLVLPKTKGSSAFYIILNRCNVRLLDPIIFLSILKWKICRYNHTLEAEAEPVKYLFPKISAGVPVTGVEGSLSLDEESELWADLQRTSGLVQRDATGEPVIGPQGKAIPLYTTHSIRHTFVFWATLSLTVQCVSSVDALAVFVPVAMLGMTIMKAGRWLTMKSLLGYMEEAGNHAKVVLPHLMEIGEKHVFKDLLPWKDPTPIAVTTAQQGVTNQLFSGRQRLMLAARHGQQDIPLTSQRLLDGHTTGSLTMATDEACFRFLDKLLCERYLGDYLNCFRNRDGNLAFTDQHSVPPQQLQPQQSEFQYQSQPLAPVLEHHYPDQVQHIGQQPEQQLHLLQQRQLLQQPPLVQQPVQLLQQSQSIQETQMFNDFNDFDDFDNLDDLFPTAENSENIPITSTQVPYIDLVYPQQCTQRFLLSTTAILPHTQTQDQQRHVVLDSSNTQEQQPAQQIESYTAFPFSLAKLGIEDVVAKVASTEFNSWTAKYQSNYPGFFIGKRDTASKALNRFLTLDSVFKLDFEESIAAWNTFFSEANKSILENPKINTNALKLKLEASLCGQNVCVGNVIPCSSLGDIISQLRKVGVLKEAEKRKRVKKA
ncbi:hypothetical protein BDR26DRAFT_885081 [Obelidium mucronatum]|nr:hypothetical protein BDR26DRAFT_885081 [Obelidium mucronatum]